MSIKTNSANDKSQLTFRQLASWAGENMHNFANGNDG